MSLLKSHLEFTKKLNNYNSTKLSLHRRQVRPETCNWNRPKVSKLDERGRRAVGSAETPGSPVSQGTTSMGGCGELLKFQSSPCTSFRACVFPRLSLLLQGSTQIGENRGEVGCDRWLWARAATTSTASPAPKATSSVLELVGLWVCGRQCGVSSENYE